MGLLDAPAAPLRLFPSYVSLPANWFSGAWFTGKAAAGTTPVWIAGIGDSTVAGTTPTPASDGFLGSGWFDKMRGKLLTANSQPAYADHYSPWAYCSGGGGDLIGEGFSNPSGCAAYEVGLGVSWGLTSVGGENTDLQTVTTSAIPGLTSASVTGFDLIWFDYNPGTWGFKVDGGQGGSPTVTGATYNSGSGFWQVTAAGGQSAGQMKRVTVRGLSAATHTITWGQCSATQCPILVGISVYQGSTGLGFVRAGFPARRAVDFGTNSGGGQGYGGTQLSAPADKISLWSGVGVNGFGGTAPTAYLTPTPFGFPTQPSAAVIGLGLNDHDAGIVPRQAGLILSRFVRALRRGVPGCNVAIMAMCRPDGWYSDSNIGAGILWNTYKREMRIAADDYGCAYIDIDTAWGQGAVGSGLMASGNIHPTLAGHTAIANLLAGIF